VERTPHRGGRPGILLCGPTCAGKSAIAEELRERFGYIEIKASEILASVDPAAGKDRRGLQAVGRKLETETQGLWLARAIAAGVGDERPIVVDAARTEGQVQALIETLSDCQVVFVTAERDERRTRFQERERTRPGYRESSFDEVEADPIEQRIEGLRAHASLTLDTTHVSHAEAVDQLAAELRLGATGRD
jgi:shikimate kinase